MENRTGDGEGEPLTLTSNQLRRMAEEADGQRGVELEIGDIERGADGKLLPRLRRAVAGVKSANGIRILTPKLAPNRPIPSRVTLVSPNSDREIPINPLRYDAVFWGEASMEKFLIPYYVRFYDNVQLAALRTAIANETVIALAHLYPTFWEEIPDERFMPAGDPSAPPRRLAEIEVFDETQVEKSESGFVSLLTWFAVRR